MNPFIRVLVLAETFQDNKLLSRFRNLDQFHNIPSDAELVRVGLLTQVTTHSLPTKRQSEVRASGVDFTFKAHLQTVQMNVLHCPSTLAR
jgi:hypothetical protein